jgi:hypothetical protein
MPLILIDAVSHRISHSPDLSLELSRRLGSHIVKSGQVTEKMLEKFYVCCQNLHD